MSKVNRLYRPEQYERQPRDFYPTPPSGDAHQAPCGQVNPTIKGADLRRDGELIDTRARAPALPANGRGTNYSNAKAT